jgi:protein phosphatase
MPFEIGSLTDVGKRRTRNEDALEVLQLASAQGALCVVADGLGGHQAGDIASRLVIDTIRQAFAEGDHPTTDTLVGAIQTANKAVFEASTTDSAKQGMGTTVLCALLRDGSAQLANVGDSPGFLVRGGQVQRLTVDHSWVAEEIARGAIRPEEAAAHPYRHVLTRSLGVDAQVDVQVYPPLELQTGDVVVLCSDGLPEHVDSRELPAAVNGRSAQAAADELVALANDRGGSDNISVIVIRWS